MLEKDKLLGQIEKLRAFLMEVSIRYLIVVCCFGLPAFLFVFCPVYFFLDGFAAQFFEYFAVGGMWFFLLVNTVSLLLVALLTAVKMLLAGFTREEKDFFKYIILLALGFAVFFVAVTSRIFMLG
jgi:hypothetical protein